MRLKKPGETISVPLTKTPSQISVLPSFVTLACFLAAFQATVAPNSSEMNRNGSMGFLLTTIGRTGGDSTMPLIMTLTSGWISAPGEAALAGAPNTQASETAIARKSKRLTSLKIEISSQKK